MPKNQRHKQRKQRSWNNKRRQRRSSCWIEDCEETTSTPSSDESSCCFVVRITRVELWDDFSRYVYGSSVPDDQVDCESAAFLVDSCVSTEVQLPRTGTTAERKDDAVGLEPQHSVNTKAFQTEKVDTGKAEGTDELFQGHVPSLICVRRAPSARKPRTVLSLSPTFKLGQSGDGIRNPHPNVDSKYWAQRRRLFSKFDDGIVLDEEGWYSVTPEAIAQHIARRIVRGKRGMIVLDAFGGAGGNTMALCQQPGVKLVVCVDIELSRLRMAANNCRVYGVESHKVLFVHANAFEVLRRYEKGHLQVTSVPDGQKLTSEAVCGFEIGSLNLLPDHIDAAFLSPPWGGPELVEEAGSRGFDLTLIKLIRSADEGDSADGEALLNTAFHALPSSKDLVYFLPRSTNGRNLAMSAIQVGFTRGLELEENILGCKLKTLTAYFGSLQVQENTE